MSRGLFKLARDESGTSIIELALLAPLLATLVIGMTDLSMAFSEKLKLEQVAQRAVEKAMQGMQGDDSTDIFNTLKAEAATTAGVPQTAVTVRYWLECNGVSQNTSASTMQADYEKVCSNSTHVYSRHLNITIEKKFTPTFNVRWLGSNSDGTFTVSGEAGLRVQ